MHSVRRRRRGLLRHGVQPAILVPPAHRPRRVRHAVAKATELGGACKCARQHKSVSLSSPVRGRRAERFGAPSAKRRGSSSSGAQAAELGPRAALDGLRTDLQWVGYGKVKGGPGMHGLLVLAAEYALELGTPADVADAEQFARSAFEIAAVDSVALGRSAFVGEASLLLARALRARGAAAEAVPWAQRAASALGAGAQRGRPGTTPLHVSTGVRVRSSPCKSAKTTRRGSTRFQAVLRRDHEV